MVGFGVLIGFASLAAVAMGTLWRDAGWPDGWPPALVAAVALCAAAVLGAGHDPDVSGGAVAAGMAIAALGIALPLAGYYALGRLMPNRVIVAGVWLVSLIPLVPYSIVLALMVAGELQCPPDAYECPV
jgi:hypothetical protein